MVILRSRHQWVLTEQQPLQTEKPGKTPTRGSSDACSKFRQKNQGLMPLAILNSTKDAI